MQVFHYCAEILKHTSLFESCDDSHVLLKATIEEGAIYNDFDGMSERLMRDSDFEEEEPNSSSCEANNSIPIEEPTVTQDDIDEYFLQSDEADHSRWTKDHELFSKNNDTRFNGKVTKLLELNNLEWEALLNTTDIKR